MSERKYRVGDLVRFSFGRRFLHGVVKEDRGPIGVKGRNLYLIELRPLPEPPAPYQIELPAVDLQLLKNAASFE